MKRGEIEHEILEWMGEGVDSECDDARFERLALALFSHQYEHGEAYRRFCDAFDRPPSRVARWQEIPAVPTGAFKEARLACFPASETQRVFHTSGSSNEARGRLELDTLELYEASLLASFGAFVCPDPQPIRFLVLAPSATDASDSSLSYMFECAAEKFSGGYSHFYVQPSSEGLHWERDSLLDDLFTLKDPCLLAGTAFAFVHLMDALTERSAKLELPAGTRVMETGGFKGRSRELTRQELHGGISECLGVPPERILNQYGMCELGSQFYEPSLRIGRATTLKRIPPWVRTRAVDPATLVEVKPGEHGVLQHFDLANTGSVLAVLTSDEGRIADGDLEIIGRVAGAEARGCSIAADVLFENRS
ncbi:MAG: CoF synthetase [bacterium]|nr:CoF synthetase [bacterium]